jgi:hypothetical protein
MSDQIMQNAPGPNANPTIGNPETVDQGRDLAAERDAEMARERAAAKAKEDRFAVKKYTAVPKNAPPAAPEYENLILKTAANNTLMDLTYPTISRYFPNLAPLFFIANYMDQLMCNTRKWTENCSGWVPPITQMYLTVMCLFQIMRAMDAAGNATPDMLIFMQQFERLFPLDDLWIPGPLVAGFRALSAFRPDANDLFAGVTASLPPTPGTAAAAAFYVLGNDVRRLIPNINVFISRLHSTCAAAQLANATDATFQADIAGPRFLSQIFGANVANNQGHRSLLASPGASFAYGGSLLLWQNAARHLATNSIPTNLDSATPTITNDSWTAQMRFEQNEHIWFAPVFSLMAKYSQFWNGSTPISKIPPTSSAAGALMLRTTNGTSMLTAPTFIDATVAPAPVVAGHYQMRTNARLVFDCQLALRDTPEAHILSGLTFAFNSYDTNAHQLLARAGPFWTLGPFIKTGHTIEILPGILQSIAREYHRDIRMESHKQ